MRKTLSWGLALGLMTASASFAQQSVSNVPDIIIDSTLDFNWSDMLVQKIRRLMVNKGYADPFKSRVEREILIADVTSGELVAPESKALIKDLGDMLGVKLLNARSKISMKNYAYEISSVKADLKTSKRDSKGLIIDGDLTVGGITVGTDAIDLILELPTANGGRMPLIEVSIVKPKIKTRDKTQLTVGAAIQLLEGKENYSFKVVRSDLVRLADQLARDPESIELTYDQIKIPAVSVRIGTKQINIVPAKVREFIVKRERNFKALMLDQLRVKIREGAAEPMLEVLEETKLARDYWINTDTVASNFNLSKVTSAVYENNLQINLTADFCPMNKFGLVGGVCVDQKATPIPKSVITPAKHQQSVDEIKGLLLSQDVNMVASVSEDYINKLLGVTYDIGLYDDMLNEAGARLGDKRAFLRLDEKGETGTLYADVIYKIEGFQGTLVGRKEIRFPLVIKCAMRFEKRLGSVPVLLIKMVDADLSDQILRYGIPELGLVSTVQNVPRFKGKVIKSIRESITEFLGKDVVSLDYPEFKGLGLETINFISDGHGRMGAQVNLEELIQSEEDDESGE